MLRGIIFSLLVALSVGASITGDASRIVGGQVAGEGQFPYMVSLRPSYTPYVHGCGGFIISSRWVGSVAHCMVNYLSHMLVLAVVGTNRQSAGGTFYRFSFWVNHPDYVYYERMNDLGIGRTRSEIIFTPLVQSIPLGSEFVEAGVAAVISGWGTVDEPLPIGRFSEELRWLTVTTITNEECKEKMIESERHRIYDENICTYDGPGVGACNGDSGSPMTAGGVVIGAVSWALPCARKLNLVWLHRKIILSCFRWNVRSLPKNIILPPLDTQRNRKTS